MQSPAPSSLEKSWGLWKAEAHRIGVQREAAGSTWEGLKKILGAGLGAISL